MTVAQAAGGADGGDVRRGQIEAAGVDQAVGVLQFTAEADGEVVGLGEGVLSLTVDGAGKGEPALAVGGLDDLGDDATGGAEGAVQTPAWACAAEAREGEGPGGEPLRDIAGLVDAHQEEGHAARGGAR